jgi:hypothetical protein
MKRESQCRGTRRATCIPPSTRIRWHENWDGSGSGSGWPAPRALTRGLGMEGNEQLVQAYGLREIATGIGSLIGPACPMDMGRVAGDALDMATLATGLQPDNPNKENVEIALAAVARVTALDVVCGASLAHQARPKPRRGLAAPIRLSEAG